MVAHPLNVLSYQGILIYKLYITVIQWSLEELRKKPKAFFQLYDFSQHIFIYIYIYIQTEKKIISIKQNSNLNHFQQLLFLTFSPPLDQYNLFWPYKKRAPKPLLGCQNWLLRWVGAKSQFPGDTRNVRRGPAWSFICALMYNFGHKISKNSFCFQSSFSQSTSVYVRVIVRSVLNTALAFFEVRQKMCKKDQQKDGKF